MNEFSDPLDSLEAELALAETHDGSPVHARLAEVRANSPESRSPWRRASVLAGGLAAACLAAALLFGRGGGSSDSTVATPVQIAVAPQDIGEDSLHLLGVNRFNPARSAEELDTLLNKPADSVSGLDLQRAPFLAYPRSEAEFDALLGVN